jgi:hypothetical protein
MLCPHSNRRFGPRGDLNNAAATGVKPTSTNPGGVNSGGSEGHADNDFATALACSMNNLANGPGVRFFNVRMAIA